MCRKLAYTLTYLGYWLCLSLPGFAQPLPDSLIARYRSLPDSGKARLLLEYGRTAPDTVSANACAREALRLARRLGNPRTEASAYLLLANVQITKGNPKTSVTLLRNALEQAKNIPERAVRQSTVCALQMTLGLAYISLGQYHQGVEAQLESFAAAKEGQDYNQMAKACINASIAFSHLDDWDNFTKYSEMAAAYAEKAGNKRVLGMALTHIGDRFAQEKATYDKALEAYNKALRCMTELEHAEGQIVILTNMATIYEGRRQISDYMACHQKVLALARRYSDSASIATATINLATGYALQNNLPMAVKYYRQGFSISQFLQQDAYQAEDAARLWADAEAKLGNFPEAYRRLLTHVELRDSLDGLRKQQTAAEIEAKFHLRTQQHEIELEKHRNAVLEAQVEHGRTQLMAAIGGILLLGLFSTAMVRLYRTKRRSSAIISEQNADLRRANEEIQTQRDHLDDTNRALSEAYRQLELDHARKTRELLDARSMQESMLPKTQPDYPGLAVKTFHRSASEVGGDYYDYTVARDGSLYIAVGDATGHGLKAAFLVATVKSYFQGECQEVPLHLLMETISEGVRNMKVEELYMALLIGHYDKGTFTFVNGAMPPLVRYKAKAGQAELIEHYGFYLGTDFRTEYHPKKLELEPGDVLVICSDGLAESESPEGELFGYERICAAVQRLAQTSATEICNGLQTEAEAWQQSQQFTDDATIMVIKAEG